MIHYWQSRANRFALRSAAILILTSFLFTTLSAPFAQASLWKERGQASRQAQRQNRMELASAKMSAGMPAAQDVFSTGRMGADIADIENALTRGEESKNALTGRFVMEALERRRAANARSGNRLDGVPSELWERIGAFGSIQKVFLAKGQDLKWQDGKISAKSPLVIHLQDVHDVYGVQRNLSFLISELTRSGAGVVGLEGSEGKLQGLETWRQYPDRESLLEVAGYLAKHGLLTGAELAGLSQENNDAEFVGLEEKQVYLDQVAAFRATLAKKSDVEKWSGRVESVLAQLKSKSYNPAQQALDASQTLFDDHKQTLGQRVEFLTSAEFKVFPASRESYPNVAKYLRTHAMEKDMDFKLIAAAQKKLLSELSKKLGREDLVALLQDSILYRLGRIGYGEFYGSLKDRSARAGVALTPEVSQYIQYLSSVEGISQEGLFNELDRLQDQAWKRTFTSPVSVQAAIHDLDADYRLAKKGLDFAMTPQDYERYDLRKEAITRINARLQEVSVLVGEAVTIEEEMGRELLASVGRFNELSHKRNQIFIGSLTRKMQDPGRNISVIVAGGYHTGGMEALLKDKNVSFITIRPKINLAEMKDGHHPLQAFIRDPLPLEKLFVQEKVTIVHPQSLGSAENFGMGRAAKTVHGLLSVLAPALGLSKTANRDSREFLSKYSAFIQANGLEAVRVSNVRTQGDLFLADVAMGASKYVVSIAIGDDASFAQQLLNNPSELLTQLNILSDAPRSIVSGRTVSQTGGLGSAFAVAEYQASLASRAGSYAVSAIASGWQKARLALFVAGAVAAAYFASGSLDEFGVPALLRYTLLGAMAFGLTYALNLLPARLQVSRALPSNSQILFSATGDGAAPSGSDFGGGFGQTGMGDNIDEITPEIDRVEIEEIKTFIESLQDTENPDTHDLRFIFASVVAGNSILGRVQIMEDSGILVTQPLKREIEHLKNFLSAIETYRALYEMSLHPDAPENLSQVMKEWANDVKRFGYGNSDRGGLFVPERFTVFLGQDFFSRDAVERRYNGQTTFAVSEVERIAEPMHDAVTFAAAGVVAEGHRGNVKGLTDKSQIKKLKDAADGAAKQIVEAVLVAAGIRALFHVSEGFGRDEVEESFKGGEIVNPDGKNGSRNAIIDVIEGTNATAEGLDDKTLKQISRAESGGTSVVVHGPGVEALGNAPDIYADQFFTKVPQSERGEVQRLVNARVKTAGFKDISDVLRAVADANRIKVSDLEVVIMNRSREGERLASLKRVQEANPGMVITQIEDGTVPHGLLAALGVKPGSGQKHKVVWTVGGSAEAFMNLAIAGAVPGAVGALALYSKSVNKTEGGEDAKDLKRKYAFTEGEIKDLREGRPQDAEQILSGNKLFTTADVDGDVEGHFSFITHNGVFNQPGVREVSKGLFRVNTLRIRGGKGFIQVDDIAAGALEHYINFGKSLGEMRQEAIDFFAGVFGNVRHGAAMVISSVQELLGLSHPVKHIQIGHLRVSGPSNLLDPIRENPDAWNWLVDRAIQTGVDSIEIVSEETDDQRLVNEAVIAGEIVDLGNGTYHARSHPKDTARTVSRTFVATNDPEDKGNFNNWARADELRPVVENLMQGASKGKTMYVIPYLMGPAGNPLEKWGTGIELTDNRYVALNMFRMARTGKTAVDAIARSKQFVRGVHVTGDLDSLKQGTTEDQRYFLTLPETREILHYGSAYGGNALLAKIAHGLRLASFDAGVNSKKDPNEPEWLVAQMGLLELEDLESGEKTYMVAGFPSASGKTNLVMMDSPAELKDKYRVRYLGDDIVWFWKDKDGTVRAINPEYGTFGVAPGTSEESNPQAIKAIGAGSGTIFTNVARNVKTNEVWWEGKSPKPTDLENWLDWEGKPISERTPEEANNVWAQPNSRFTTKIDQVEVRSSMWDSPEGVKLGAVIWGGRVDTTVEPLVRQLRSTEEGVYDGSVMNVQVTAAIETKATDKPDPMAMDGFYSYPENKYFSDWMSMMEGMPFFHVNWFQRRADRSFRWPGYVHNIRVLDWITKRIKGEAGAVETPIGFVPAAGSLDLRGLNMSDEDLSILLGFDASAWKAEMARREVFLFNMNEGLPQGRSLPAELMASHERVKEYVAQAERGEFRPASGNGQNSISLNSGLNPWNVLSWFFGRGTGGYDLPQGRVDFSLLWSDLRTPSRWAPIRWTFGRFQGRNGLTLVTPIGDRGRTPEMAASNAGAEADATFNKIDFKRFERMEMLRAIGADFEGLTGAVPGGYDFEYQPGGNLGMEVITVSNTSGFTMKYAIRHTARAVHPLREIDRSKLAGEKGFGPRVVYAGSQRAGERTAQIVERYIDGSESSYGNRKDSLSKAERTVFVQKLARKVYGMLETGSVLHSFASLESNLMVVGSGDSIEPVFTDWSVNNEITERNRLEKASDAIVMIGSLLGHDSFAFAQFLLELNDIASDKSDAEGDLFAAAQADAKERLRPQISVRQTSSGAHLFKEWVLANHILVAFHSAFILAVTAMEPDLRNEVLHHLFASWDTIYSFGLLGLTYWVAVWWHERGHYWMAVNRLTLKASALKLAQENQSGWKRIVWEAKMLVLAPLGKFPGIQRIGLTYRVESPANLSVEAAGPLTSAKLSRVFLPIGFGLLGMVIVIGFIDPTNALTGLLFAQLGRFFFGIGIVTFLDRLFSDPGKVAEYKEQQRRAREKSESIASTADSTSWSSIAASVKKQMQNSRLQQVALNNGVVLRAPWGFRNSAMGGEHTAKQFSESNISFQEGMFIPLSAKNYEDAQEMTVTMQNRLLQIIKDSDGCKFVGVGLEGGLAAYITPEAGDKIPEQRLWRMMKQAIEESGYVPGKDVVLALDPAASELENMYREESGIHDAVGQYYFYRDPGTRVILGREQLLDIYVSAINSGIPIVSIEDGFAEDDLEGWKLLQETLGDKIFIVGDDLVTTNDKTIEDQRELFNAQLTKANQIGTLSETISAMLVAIGRGKDLIISHRSQSPNDPFEADIALAYGSLGLKAGGGANTERLVKYQRVLETMKEAAKKVFGGSSSVQDFVVGQITAYETPTNSGNPTVKVKIEVAGQQPFEGATPLGTSAGTGEAIHLVDSMIEANAVTQRHPDLFTLQKSGVYKFRNGVTLEEIKSKNDGELDALWKSAGRYEGKGVVNAVENVDNAIAPLFVGKKISELGGLVDIDNRLLSLEVQTARARGKDVSDPIAVAQRKQNLGMNAILATSLALARAKAQAEGKEYWEILREPGAKAMASIIAELKGNMNDEESLHRSGIETQYSDLDDFEQLKQEFAWTVRELLPDGVRLDDLVRRHLGLYENLDAAAEARQPASGPDAPNRYILPSTQKIGDSLFAWIKPGLARDLATGWVAALVELHHWMISSLSKSYRAKFNEMHRYDRGAKPIAFRMLQLSFYYAIILPIITVLVAYFVDAPALHRVLDNYGVYDLDGSLPSRVLKIVGIVTLPTIFVMGILSHGFWNTYATLRNHARGNRASPVYTLPGKSAQGGEPVWSTRPYEGSPRVAGAIYDDFVAEFGAGAVTLSQEQGPTGNMRGPTVIITASNGVDSKKYIVKSTHLKVHPAYEVDRSRRAGDLGFGPRVIYDEVKNQGARTAVYVEEWLEGRPLKEAMAGLSSMERQIVAEKLAQMVYAMFDTTAENPPAHALDKIGDHLMIVGSGEEIRPVLVDWGQNSAVMDSNRKIKLSDAIQLVSYGFLNNSAIFADFIASLRKIASEKSAAELDLYDGAYKNAISNLRNSRISNVVRFANETEVALNSRKGPNQGLKARLEGGWVLANHMLVSFHSAFILSFVHALLFLPDDIHGSNHILKHIFVNPEQLFTFGLFFLTYWVGVWWHERGHYWESVKLLTLKKEALDLAQENRTGFKRLVWEAKLFAMAPSGRFPGVKKEGLGYYVESPFNLAVAAAGPQASARMAKVALPAAAAFFLLSMVDRQLGLLGSLGSLSAGYFLFGAGRLFFGVGAVGLLDRLFADKGRVKELQERERKAREAREGTAQAAPAGSWMERVSSVKKQLINTRLQEVTLSDGTRLRAPWGFRNSAMGGEHTKAQYPESNISLQEGMFIPLSAKNYEEAQEMTVRLQNRLLELINGTEGTRFMGIGLEGGLSAYITPEEGDKIPEQRLWRMMKQAIEDSGYVPGVDVVLALDPATSELQNAYREKMDQEDAVGQYYFYRDPSRDVVLSRDELLDIYVEAMEAGIPIVSIEDPFAEDDLEGWKMIIDKLGKDILVIGDDLVTTNDRVIEDRRDLINAQLTKANQIGTVSETISAMLVAIGRGIDLVISHRSQSPNDPFEAYLALAYGAAGLKAGGGANTERLVKYQAVLETMKEAMEKAQSGDTAGETHDYTIRGVTAYETPTNSGNPTVKVKVSVDGHQPFEGATPLGTSAGTGEAIHLLDSVIEPNDVTRRHADLFEKQKGGDGVVLGFRKEVTDAVIASLNDAELTALWKRANRYKGKGVQNAVGYVDRLISRLFVGKKVSQIGSIVDIDNQLLALELQTARERGKDTSDVIGLVQRKQNLGMNAILATSLAMARLKAQAEGKELWQIYREPGAKAMASIIAELKGNMNDEESLHRSGIETQYGDLDEFEQLKKEFAWTVRELLPEGERLDDLVRRHLGLYANLDGAAAQTAPDAVQRLSGDAFNAFALLPVSLMVALFSPTWGLVLGGITLISGAVMGRKQIARSYNKVRSAVAGQSGLTAKIAAAIAGLAVILPSLVWQGTRAEGPAATGATANQQVSAQQSSLPYRMIVPGLAADSVQLAPIPAFANESDFRAWVESHPKDGVRAAIQSGYSLDYLAVREDAQAQDLAAQVFASNALSPRDVLTALANNNQNQEFTEDHFSFGTQGLYSIERGLVGVYQANPALGKSILDYMAARPNETLPETFRSRTLQESLSLLFVDVLLNTNYNQTNQPARQDMVLYMVDRLGNNLVIAVARYVNTYGEPSFNEGSLYTTFSASDKSKIDGVFQKAKQGSNTTRAPFTKNLFGQAISLLSLGSVSWKPVKRGRVSLRNFLAGFFRPKLTARAAYKGSRGDSLIVEAAKTPGMRDSNSSNPYYRIGYEGNTSRLGWVVPPSSDEALNYARKIDPYLTGVEHVIFVGMGGSINSVKAFKGIMGQGRIPIDALDSLDPAALAKAVAGKDLSKTLVVAISKSATTAETLALTAILGNLVNAASGKQDQPRVLVLTDPENIQKLPEAYRGANLPIQVNGGNDIGGRFTAPLTGTWLLPMYLYGGNQMQESYERFLENYQAVASWAQLKALDLHGENRNRIAVVVESREIKEAMSTWIIQLFQESLGSKIDGFYPKTIVVSSDEKIPAGFTALDLPLYKGDRQSSVMVLQYGLESFVAEWARLKDLNFVDQEGVEVYKRETRRLISSGEELVEPLSVSFLGLVVEIQKYLEKDPKDFVDVVLYGDYDQNQIDRLRASLQSRFQNVLVQVFVGSDWNHHSYQAAKDDPNTLYVILQKSDYPVESAGPAAASSRDVLEANVKTLKIIARATYNTLESKALFHKIDDKFMRNALAAGGTSSSRSSTLRALAMLPGALILLGSAIVLQACGGSSSPKVAPTPEATVEATAAASAPASPATQAPSATATNAPARTPTQSAPATATPAPLTQSEIDKVMSDVRANPAQGVAILAKAGIPADWFLFKEDPVNETLSRAVFADPNLDVKTVLQVMDYNYNSPSYSAQYSQDNLIFGTEGKYTFERSLAKIHEYNPALAKRIIHFLITDQQFRAPYNASSDKTSEEAIIRLIWDLLVLDTSVENKADENRALLEFMMDNVGHELLTEAFARLIKTEPEVLEAIVKFETYKSNNDLNAGFYLLDAAHQVALNEILVNGKLAAIADRGVDKIQPYKKSAVGLIPTLAIVAVIAGGALKSIGWRIVGFVKPGKTASAHFDREIEAYQTPALEEVQSLIHKLGRLPFSEDWAWNAELMRAHEIVAAASLPMNVYGAQLDKRLSAEIGSLDHVLSVAHAYRVLLLAGKGRDDYDPITLKRKELYHTAREFGISDALKRVQTGINSPVSFDVWLNDKDFATGLTLREIYAKADTELLAADIAAIVERMDAESESRTRFSLLLSLYNSYMMVPQIRRGLAGELHEKVRSSVSRLNVALEDEEDPFSEKAAAVTVAIQQVFPAQKGTLLPSVALPLAIIPVFLAAAGLPTAAIIVGGVLISVGFLAMITQRGRGRSFFAGAAALIGGLAVITAGSILAESGENTATVATPDPANGAAQTAAIAQAPSSQTPKAAATQASKFNSAEERDAAKRSVQKAVEALPKDQRAKAIDMLSEAGFPADWFILAENDPKLMELARDVFKNASADGRIIAVLDYDYTDPFYNGKYTEDHFSFETEGRFTFERSLLALYRINPELAKNVLQSMESEIDNNGKLHSKTDRSAEESLALLFWNVLLADDVYQGNAQNPKAIAQRSLALQILGDLGRQQLVASLARLFATYSEDASAPVSPNAVINSFPQAQRNELNAIVAEAKAAAPNAVEFNNAGFNPVTALISIFARRSLNAYINANGGTNWSLAWSDAKAIFAKAPILAAVPLLAGLVVAGAALGVSSLGIGAGLAMIPVVAIGFLQTRKEVSSWTGRSDALKNAVLGLRDGSVTESAVESFLSESADRLNSIKSFNHNAAEAQAVGEIAGLILALQASGKSEAVVRSSIQRFFETAAPVLFEPTRLLDQLDARQIRFNLESSSNEDHLASFEEGLVRGYGLAAYATLNAAQKYGERQETPAFGTNGTRMIDVSDVVSGSRQTQEARYQIAAVERTLNELDLESGAVNKGVVLLATSQRALNAIRSQIKSGKLARAIELGRVRLIVDADPAGRIRLDKVASELPSAWTQSLELLTSDENRFVDSFTLKITILKLLSETAVREVNTLKAITDEIRQSAIIQMQA